ncbi:site-specific integrase [Actinomadura litoris]|uniref:site-specific integrase n=1 Tax=Actinomadura litoris TaxID=2678616 RepID=UPI001FA7E63F|nr:site-specific integrase [Actinomadura litoris]
MLSLVRAPAPEPVGDQVAAQLWPLIEEEFLGLLGWDRAVRVVTMPTDHLVLGIKVCRVINCTKPSYLSVGICVGCDRRRRQSGQPVEEFVVTAKRRWRSTGVGPCSVPGCARPWKTRAHPLCTAHDYQRTDVFKLPLEEFIGHPDVVPLERFGPCAVRACYRDQVGPKTPYCQVHLRHLSAHRDREGFDEAHWRLTGPAIAEGRMVSLRGLPDRVVAQALYGLQERTKTGTRTKDFELRNLCDRIRLAQLGSVDELPEEGLSKPVLGLRNAVTKICARVGLTPETERHKDVWQMSPFGLAGTIRFADISQPWLREATKRWAFEDIPKRRAKKIPTIVQNHINAMVHLSDSLRLQRDDHGDDLAALSRTDMTAFCNRMAYLVDTGNKSLGTRINQLCHIKRMFSQMRAAGLTRPGEPLHGLPDDFTLTDTDIPNRPEDEEAGRDLPVEVMRHLAQHLPDLDGWNCLEVRVAVELLMDTGRRPDEIARLNYDCLERDGDGKPVLIYDNFKAHRNGRRLPIAEATAGVITQQQERVRARFPDTPIAELKLLPSSRSNRAGTKPLSDGWIGDRHRQWVETLPPVQVATVVEIDGELITKMLPFDTEKIFLYAYRHTYAQRHADAGVPVDVLRQLMDHRRLGTSQKYYRVGEERRREAVERVTTMQFDRHGNRVWRDAQALLDSEHTRRAIGEVAVPYGVCTEPTNVAADGQDCPVRFRCVGCGHFRTDISYLPDLEAHLADLLRNRERLIAMTDADEWAKTEAMPSDQEIRRIRRLISRVRDDMDGLSTEDKQQILDAVNIVRRHRTSTVGLGMPRVRQPRPDLQPERIA